MRVFGAAPGVRHRLHARVRRTLHAPHAKPTRTPPDVRQLARHAAPVQKRGLLSRVVGFLRKAFK